jgi:phosphoenolpyruvate-protein kinase (PTS system EI component)
MVDLVKAIQPPLDVAAIAIAEIAKAMQPPAHLTVVAQMMTAMRMKEMSAGICGAVGGEGIWVPTSQ